jgi:predicted DCC family thiol-disulfide oxidoreductase YuxK
VNYQTPITLFYDADCGFCQSSVDNMKARDSKNLIKLIAYQTPNLKTLYPEINPEHAHRGIQVLDAEKNVVKNEKAIAWALLRLPTRAWLGHLILFPLFRPFTAIGYRIIASNRHRISRFAGKTECKLPQ